MDMILFPTACERWNKAIKQGRIVNVYGLVYDIATGQIKQIDTE